MIGSVFKKVAWLFIAGSIALAVVKGVPADPDGFIAYFQDKAVEAKDAAGRFVDNISSEIQVKKPTKGLIPEPKEPSPSPAPKVKK